jgi:hypothetical protein
MDAQPCAKHFAFHKLDGNQRLGLVRSRGIYGSSESTLQLKISDRPPLRRSRSVPFLTISFNLITSTSPEMINFLETESEAWPYYLVELQLMSFSPNRGSPLRDCGIIMRTMLTTTPKMR